MIDFRRIRPGAIASGTRRDRDSACGRREEIPACKDQYSGLVADIVMDSRGDGGRSRG